MTCKDCKYFNIDDKDGSISTMYPYCEVEEISRRNPHDMADGKLDPCRKWRGRLKCECPYNKSARAEKDATHEH